MADQELNFEYTLSVSQVLSQIAGMMKMLKKAESAYIKLADASKGAAGKMGKIGIQAKETAKGLKTVTTTVVTMVDAFTKSTKVTKQTGDVIKVVSENIVRDYASQARAAIRATSDIKRTEKRKAAVAVIAAAKIVSANKLASAKIIAASKSVADKRIADTIRANAKIVSANKLASAKIIADRIKAAALVSSQERKFAFISTENRRKEQLRLALAVERSSKRQVKATNKVTKASKGVLLSWRSMVRVFSTRIAYSAMISISGAIREGVTAASDLSKRIAEIQSISQDVPLTFNKWAEGLRGVSDAYGLDLLETVESGYQAISNQVAKGAESFTFMSEAAKFATATMTSLPDSVNLISSAMNAFGYSVEDSEYIAASFFKTIELGRIRGSEIANTYGNVAVVAAQLGVTMNDLNTMLAMTSIKGMKARVVMTHMRGVLNSLLKPTQAMKAFFKELGVESGQMAIDYYTLAGVMKKMATYTGEHAAEIAKLVPRIRGIPVALIATSKEGQNYADTLKKMEEAGKSYSEGAKITMTSIGKQFDIQVTKLKNFFTADIGQAIMETMIDFTKYFGDFVNIVKASFIGMAAAGAAITGALAGIAIGFVAVNGLAGTFTVILTALSAHPVIAIATAFVLLTAAITAASAVIEKGSKAAEKRYKKQYENTLKEYKKNLRKQVKAYKDAEDDKYRISAKANAEIVKKANKTLKTLEGYYKSSYESLVTGFEVIGKGLKASVATIESTIKKSESILKNLVNNTKSMVAELEDLIFDEKLKGKDPVQQAEIISKKILEIRKAHNEALRKGQAVLAQDFLKQAMDLEKRLIAISENGKQQLEDLEKKLGDARKARSKEEADAREKDNEARKTADKDLVDLEEENRKKRTGKELREWKVLYKEKKAAILLEHKQNTNNLKDLIAENKKTIKDLIAEKKKLAGIGSYSDNAVAKYKEYISLALEQQKILAAAVKEKIEREKQLRISALNAVAVHEAGLKAFKDRDIKEQLGGAKSTKDVAKIMVDRAKEIDFMEKAIASMSEGKQKTALEQQLILIKNNELNQAEIVKEKIKVQLMQEELRLKRKELEIEIKKQEKELQEKMPVISQYKTDIQRIQNEIKKDIINLSITAKEFSTKGLRDWAQRELDTLEMQLKLIESIDKQIKSGKDPFEGGGNLAENLRKVFEELGKRNNTIKDVLNRVATTNASTVYKQITAIKDALAVEAKLMEADTKTTTNNTKNTNVKIANTNRLITIQKELIALYKKSSEQRGVSDQAIRNIPTKAQGGIVRHFAEGGQAYGTDTVAAMLTPGEFVMNAASTRKFHSQLVAMNSRNNSLRNYSDGGNVSVGDININMSSSGNESYDIQKIGKGIRREIRRGTLKLN